jgi:hypothetical protein
VFGQDRSPVLRLQFFMHPLEQLCIDVDQSKIVSGHFFSDIVGDFTEMLWLALQDKSSHMRHRTEAYSERRGYHGGTASACICVAGLRPRSACFFDPEFTPTRRTDFAIDERTGIRLLEQRAITTLLIALWCGLIFGRFLSHFSGSFLD